MVFLSDWSTVRIIDYWNNRRLQPMFQSQNKPQISWLLHICSQARQEAVQAKKTSSPQRDTQSLHVFFYKQKHTHCEIDKESSAPLRAGSGGPTRLTWQTEANRSASGALHLTLLLLLNQNKSPIIQLD